jgi:BT1 family
VEATLFALLMSVWNLSLLLSNEFGALLTSVLGITETNFDRLWLLVIITNLSTLLPLLFIGWLPAKDPQPTEDDISDKMLSPTEAAPHRLVGSAIESSFLPDLVPEFIINKSAKKDREL